MVSATTNSREPALSVEQDVVAWTRESINKFAEARAEQARLRVGVDVSSRLPPSVAVDAILLIEKLSELLK